MGAEIVNSLDPSIYDSLDRFGQQTTNAIAINARFVDAREKVSAGNPIIMVPIKDEMTANTKPRIAKPINAFTMFCIVIPPIVN